MLLAGIGSGQAGLKADWPALKQAVHYIHVAVTFVGFKMNFSHLVLCVIGVIIEVS